MKQEKLLKLLFELIKNSKRSDRDLAKILDISQPTVTRLRKVLEKTSHTTVYHNSKPFLLRIRPCSLHIFKNKRTGSSPLGRGKRMGKGATKRGFCIHWSRNGFRCYNGFGAQGLWRFRKVLPHFQKRLGQIPGRFQNIYYKLVRKRYIKTLHIQPPNRGTPKSEIANNVIFSYASCGLFLLTLQIMHGKLCNAPNVEETFHHFPQIYFCFSKPSPKTYAFGRLYQPYFSKRHMTDK